ncbi:MAG: hypothetical protein ABSD74_01215 [Rhizomicrobium sp.]|jgi:hypothetical protein
MRFSQALLSGIVIAGLVAAPLSSAQAGWRHRDGHVGLIGGLFGLATGVVVGAATIATAPLAIAAGAGRQGYDGPPPAAYGPPPGYGPQQGAYYGPPPGYAPPQGAYYGPPPANFTPPPANAAAPGAYYGPPRPYYGPQAYAPAPQYNAPPNGYYGPPPGN